MNDYAGPFDADFQLATLSRRALAALGREQMLFGHLINRAALPLVHVALGPAAREAVAIDTWMAASPIYTPWMQRALGFAGDDVGTIFKSLQLDVGFAHQYMDVRYELESAARGFFWLQSCGALLQIEPQGEAAVISMCHHIEDPTFDASAVATNPRARCRPIHRPPRQPADRVPHCRWEVFVDPDAPPLTETALATRLRASRLAALPIPAVADGEPGGWPDYARPFAPDFRLEDLSHAALVAACTGFLLQDQLLVLAFATTVADRAGAEVARELARRAWIGCGPVASRRVCSALGIAGDDASAIARMLQLHPAFLPGYLAPAVALDGDRIRLSLAACEARHEPEPVGWSALLADGIAPALDAMVQAVNPRARSVATGPLAWEVRLDGEPAPEPRESQMVAATGTAQFRFASRP